VAQDPFKLQRVRPGVAMHLSPAVTVANVQSATRSLVQKSVQSKPSTWTRGSTNAAASFLVVASATSAASRSRSSYAPGFSHRRRRAPQNPRICALATTATSTGEVTDAIDGLIADHKVVIFSKSWCPYCSQAKDILKTQGIDFHVMELDEKPSAEAEAFQDALHEMTGARTVPRIFISGQCIGGCDDLTALQMSGKLDKNFLEDITSAEAKGLEKLILSEDEWRKKLGPQEYYVLRQQGTESPGSHEYNNFMPPEGHFECKACGLPLYSADSKFRSNCGWPVFDKCYYSETAAGCHVGTKAEFGGLEIVCNRCDSHLGHVFFDAFSAKNPNGERH